MILLEKIGTLLTLSGAAQKSGRRVLESDLGIFHGYSMVFSQGKIQWLGPDKKIPKDFRKKIRKSILARDWTVMPGLIESHTHSVFAGSRSAEFEMRLQGKSYQEIAASGGGILSTVKATRKESAGNLLKITQDRVNNFIAQGVSTLEIKTGYALDEKNELKLLKTIRSLKGPRVISTFLGAHAIPPEFKDENDYLDFLMQKVFPKLANKTAGNLAQKKSKGLADRVDIFVEKGFFSSASAKKYLNAARQLGLPTTIHADQLTLSGGTDLAIELQSQSADHLIQIGDKEIARLAKSDVTAGLLPVADIYMKCPFPPARRLIDAGVRVALATDFNPGTCPSMDINLVGLISRLEMKMSLPEVISAYTVGAAHALGLAKITGSLEVGKSADFLCTTNEWTDLFYSPGKTLMEKVFLEGSPIFPQKYK